MRVSRIFTDQPLVDGSEIELDARANHYVRQVLRLRSGQSLTLFNGDGKDFAAELTACDRHSCRAYITEVLGTERPPTLTLHLGMGISRGERMDFAIQKSVELGVERITPLHTARGGVRLPAARLAKRLDHWRGIIINACEQCGRKRIPRLDEPQELAAWLDAYPGGVLLDPSADRSLPELPPPQETLTLLVGPEGGLDDREHAMAKHARFNAVRLGPRVLRTETAPLAAIAAIQVLWGDYR